MISDPDKKKRFFTPIGSVLMILGLFFIIEGVLLFYATGNGEYIYGQTWSIVIFVIGFFLILHGYGLIDRLIEYVEYGVKNIRSGNVAITFSLLSLALIIVGISVGIYSIWDTQIKDPIYIVSEFAVNALWPIIFAIMFWDIGKLVNNFIKLKKVNRSFLVGTIAVIGIGFLLQGLLDTISTILGYGAVDNMSILLEFIGGIILTVSASILQSNFRRYFNKKKEMI